MLLPHGFISKTSSNNLSNFLRAFFGKNIKITHEAAAFYELSKIQFMKRISIEFCNQQLAKVNRIFFQRLKFLSFHIMRHFSSTKTQFITRVQARAENCEFCCNSRKKEGSHKQV